MKRLNKNGFTLIELLAVITIMGILMMVAIPSVTRTIENSRRDTFADVASAYVNAVRNAVLADELICGDSGSGVSSMPNGGYYYQINSDDESVKDLMESGGTSSWGGAVVHGYVVWYKEQGTITTTTTGSDGSTTTSSTDSANSQKTTYSIVLVDSGNHGIPYLIKDGNLKRTVVKTDVAKTNSSFHTAANSYYVKKYEDVFSTTAQTDAAVTTYGVPKTVINYRDQEVVPVNSTGASGLTQCKIG